MASAPALNLNREDSRGFYADEQLAAALAYFRAGYSSFGSNFSETEFMQ